MIKFEDLKVGGVLSESQFYKIVKIKDDKMQVTNGTDNIILQKDYIEKCLFSADQFTSEEYKTGTELIDIIKSAPRTAMSIYFKKKDEKKAKKLYESELLAKSEELVNNILDNGKNRIIEALRNPILPYTVGEMRLIKGFYTGSETEDGRGRLLFVDIEDDKRMVKEVDSRTIEYVIVNNIKYCLK